MGCCDDPTEPSKIDPRELIREHDCMDRFLLQAKSAFPRIPVGYAGGRAPKVGALGDAGAVAEERYGNLVRDLFTDDPEKVILKQLNEANIYLRELAALRAHYDSVRKHAIGLLGKASAPAHAPYLHLTAMDGGNAE